MNFRLPTKKSRNTRIARRDAAFTLAEVLAALAFVALVVPVAIQALQIATLAGEVADRKVAATRVAERLLNESIVTTNWMQSSPRGSVVEGAREFEWTLQNDYWTEGQMRLLTIEVHYKAQGKDYSVQLSTLADSSAPFSDLGTVQ